MKPAGVARRVWAALWFAGLVATQPAGLRAEAADAETVAETVSAAATAAPAGTPCPGLAAVRVRSASAGDAALACEGAARALRFLGDAGLVLPEMVEIELADELPGDMRGQAVGCYVPGLRRIFLLTYPAFVATGSWFRQPVEPELYRAAASHEVAHAVAACNVAADSPPLAANEYTAYVVMFATMAPDLRRRILADFPGQGLANTLQIHPFVYLADPLQFGVDAWRHYLRRPDGAAWLRDLVAGRIVQDLPTDGP